MKLNELAATYKESERLISDRLKALRKEERETDDSIERERLKRRILDLKPILTEVRAVRLHIEHYYDGVRNKKFLI